MSLRHAPTPTSMNHERRGGTNTHIAGRWLFVTRFSFVVVSIFTLLLYVIGTPVYFPYLHTLCTDCLDDRLNPDKLQALHALGISITTYAVYMVALNLLFALVYFAVAALIFWRKSDDWIAWLASFSLVAFGASFPSIPAVLAAVHPVWQLPVTLVSEDVLGFRSLIIFFFLFPTGRFVPRWTRWVAIGTAVLFVATSFFPVPFFNFSTRPGLLFLLVQLVVFGSLVFSQVYRYRHVSTPVERQQTKWIVFGVAVGLLGFLLLGVFLPAFLQLFIPPFAELKSTPACHPGHEHLPAAPADPALACHCHLTLPTVGCGCAHQQDPGLWDAHRHPRSALHWPRLRVAIPVAWSHQPGLNHCHCRLHARDRSPLPTAAPSSPKSHRPALLSSQV